MHKIVVAAFVLALAAPQDHPPMPKPAKEHEWLQKFVGEWEHEGEFVMEPGKPPVKSKGSESVRAIGGFWVLSEIKGDMMGSPFTGILTVGYDPEKKKYIGTWVDSATSTLWKYEGSVDKDGKVLTLEAEGPNPAAGGRLTKFRDATEFKDKDHKVFTSSMQGDDGKWTTFMTVNCTRKK